MKTFFLPVLLILASCSSHSEEQAVKETLPAESTDEKIPDKSTETEEPSSPETLSKEDSIAFYTAIAKEQQLIMDFCKCAKKHGGASTKCRDFLKQMIPQQQISDKLRNVYIYNDKVYDVMTKEIESLNEQCNTCSDYPEK